MRFIKKSHAKKPIAKVALVKATKAMSLLNKREQKFVVTTKTPGNVPASGQIDCLTLTAQGDDNDADRSGDQIVAKSLEFRYRLLPLDDTVRPNLVRIIMFKWRDTRGTMPVITDVLNTSDPLSGYNVDNKGNYVILHDKTHHVGYQGDSGGGNMNPGMPIIVNGVAKLSGRDAVIRYTGTTAVIASTSVNHIFVLYVSDTNDPNNRSNLNYVSTFRYTDP